MSKGRTLADLDAAAESDFHGADDPTKYLTPVSARSLTRDGFAAGELFLRDQTGAVVSQNSRFLSHRAYGPMWFTIPQDGMRVIEIDNHNNIEPLVVWSRFILWPGLNQPLRNVYDPDLLFAGQLMFVMGGANDEIGGASWWRTSTYSHPTGGAWLSTMYDWASTTIPTVYSEMQAYKEVGKITLLQSHNSATGRHWIGVYNNIGNQVQMLFEEMKVFYGTGV